MSQGPVPKHPEDPRFQVSVEGGKGTVVGDYATVFQYFGQAPTSLSDRIRTRDFQSLVDDRTRQFTGRDYVFRAIDDTIGDPELPSGYIVIHGEPGIGKTSVMAWLVRSRGYVHHFNVAPLGIRSPQAFLSNLCAQLIVRYGLDHRSLPPEATEDGGFLARLLSEAAEKPEHCPVVVLVDALDEAEDVALPPGANRLFLPPTVPTGVYIIVTTRDQHDYRLSVEAERDIYLRDDSPENLDDVRAFIATFLKAYGEKLRPNVQGWGLSDEDLIETLTAKSEGNFMYLVHVLRDLRDAKLTAETVGDVHRLPKGLRDYYRRHWATMKSRDKATFDQLQQPVVCLLATVREPVTIAQLAEWTKLDPVEIRDAVREWWEFLDAEPSDGGEPRFRIYHASFQDFLKDEVGLTLYHDLIGQSALSKIPGFRSSG